MTQTDKRWEIQRGRCLINFPSNVRVSGRACVPWYIAPFKVFWASNFWIFIFKAFTECRTQETDGLLWNLNNPKEPSKPLGRICSHASFEKVYYIHQRLGWLIRKALVGFVIQDLMCCPQTVLTGAILNLFYSTLPSTVTSQAKAIMQNDWLIICMVSFLKSKAFSS